MSGPALCRAMGSAGFDMTEWKAASLRSISYECNHLRFIERDPSHPLRSVFMRVRGNARGEILDIRGMLVDPPTLADGGLDQELMRVFETIIDQTRWFDVRRVLPLVQKLENAEHAGFGAKFIFAREAGDRPRYSFALMVETSRETQMQTSALRQATIPYRVNR